MQCARHIAQGIHSNVYTVHCIGVHYTLNALYYSDVNYQDALIRKFPFNPPDLRGFFLDSNFFNMTHFKRNKHDQVFSLQLPLIQPFNVNDGFSLVFFVSTKNKTTVCKRRGEARNRQNKDLNKLLVIMKIFSFH